MYTVAMRDFCSMIEEQTKWAAEYADGVVTLRTWATEDEDEELIEHIEARNPEDFLEEFRGIAEDFDIFRHLSRSTNAQGTDLWGLDLGETGVDAQEIQRFYLESVERMEELIEILKRFQNLSREKDFSLSHALTHFLAEYIGWDIAEPEDGERYMVIETPNHDTFRAPLPGETPGEMIGNFSSFARSFNRRAYVRARKKARKEGDTMVPSDTVLSTDAKNVQMILDSTAKLMGILRPLVCPVPQAAQEAQA